MKKSDDDELKNNQTQEKNKKTDIQEKDTNSKEIEEDKKEKNTRRRIVLIIATIALVVIAIIFRGNYLEMREMGENYLTVFWQNTIYLSITFILNFTFLFCAFFFTNKIIKKGVKIFFEDEKMEVPKFPNKSISFIIALLGSTLTSRLILNKILLCFSNSKFGITDGIFNLDISFLVFHKPLIQFLIIYLIIIVAATLAYGLVYSIVILNRSVNRNIARDTSKIKYSRHYRIKSKTNSNIGRIICYIYNGSKYWKRKIYKHRIK